MFQTVNWQLEWPAVCDSLSQSFLLEITKTNNYCLSLRVKKSLSKSSENDISNLFRTSIPKTLATGGHSLPSTVR